MSEPVHLMSSAESASGRPTGSGIDEFPSDETKQLAMDHRPHHQPHPEPLRQVDDTRHNSSPVPMIQTTDSTLDSTTLDSETTTTEDMLIGAENTSSETMVVDPEAAEEAVPQATGDESSNSQLIQASSSPVPPTLTQTASEEDSAVYQLKWIRWKGKETAIILQSHNGPCPLLAVLNVLLLRARISIPAGTEVMSSESLMELLGNVLIDMPNNLSESAQLNYEQNVSDAISILPKLLTGLDVNVKFNEVTNFEYTETVLVFDLLRITLYHGWLYDQTDSDLRTAIGSASYNQLVEKVVTDKSSDKSEAVAEAVLAEYFLENTASQLTEYGLAELVRQVEEDQLGVLFRNNHFITLYKKDGKLYQLVTDQGFFSESNVVWETLNNIVGAGVFVDGDFHPAPPKESLATAAAGTPQSQIDRDYQLALSLSKEDDATGLAEANMTDEEFARKLQEEEDETYRKQQQQQQQSQGGQTSLEAAASMTSTESIAGSGDDGSWAAPKRGKSSSPHSRNNSPLPPFSNNPYRSTPSPVGGVMSSASSSSHHHHHQHQFHSQQQQQQPQHQQHSSVTTQQQSHLAQRTRVSQSSGGGGGSGSGTGRAHDPTTQHHHHHQQPNHVAAAPASHPASRPRSSSSTSSDERGGGGDRRNSKNCSIM